MTDMTSSSATSDAFGPGDLSPDAAAQAARDEEAVRRNFWSKLKGTASRIPFAEDAVAAYYAAFDRATPFKVRAMLLAALAYFILPLDVAPDLFPLIGFTDDAAVLMAALRLLSGHVKPEHYEAARSALEGIRPRKA